jgi:hypothetical protein
MGRAWASKARKQDTDYRTLEEVGIVPDMRFEAIPLITQTTDVGKESRQLRRYGLFDFADCI